MIDLNEYNREIERIFKLFPTFQSVGGSAYKPGIQTMVELDSLLGEPHKKFTSIHIAGTNGKGSTSHMIASALTALPQKRIGLYTSPHLTDFRERMKISFDGAPFVMPSREFVYDFLIRYKEDFTRLKASFFEITTAMAFYWFAENNVDIAIIECGLGGRLDATNILTPALSIITNIGLDHCEYLGNTIEEIALEKAGIIKQGVPVVIGEKSGVEKVFISKAGQLGAPLFFAQEYCKEPSISFSELDLKGACQAKNIKVVESALKVLGLFSSDMLPKIYRAAELSGLHGRWEQLMEQPFVVCDTGHNGHGFSLLGKQILEAVSHPSKEGRPYKRLLLFFGVVADKDISLIAEYLPLKWKNSAGEEKKTEYIFVKAQGKRALPLQALKERMMEIGIEGKIIATSTESDNSVEESLALYFGGMAEKDDFVFIGGSTYVVAEALEFFKKM